MTMRHGDAQQGTVTIWLLGLLTLVLLLGGVSLDLWRAFDAWRGVSSVADAAATAGASGIDTEHLYATDQVRLDPAAARRRARASLTRNRDAVDDAAITVTPDGTAVTVTTTRRLQLTLLSVLSGELDARTVGASATVEPREQGVGGRP